MQMRITLILGAAAIAIGTGVLVRYPVAGVDTDSSEAISHVASPCGPGIPLSAYVDSTGCISLPRDAHLRWAHLGSWTIPGDGGGVHDVYTQPETVEAFRRDGRFPDGAVLVKSVRHVADAQLTTGNAHWATDQDVWFVMVKDSRNRFEGRNRLWGQGWGWALFDAANPDSNVATDFRRDCLGCHTPRRDRDWVYLEGYPALR